MTRLLGHGEGSSRSFHQVIMLGCPPRCLPAIDLNVVEALKPRGPVSVLEEDLGGGTYLFAGDGSGVRAWIPFFDAKAPARSSQAVLDWLTANGIEARFVGRASEPHPDLPTGCEPVGITLPKAAEASPPARPTPAKAAQLDLFG